MSPLHELRLTSRNLLSCRSWPFSPRNCVTMRMASSMMLVLSVFAVLPGSSTLASSVNLSRGRVNRQSELMPLHELIHSQICTRQLPTSLAL